MFFLDIVNNEVIKNDKFVLLVVELTLLLKYLVELRRVDEELEAKITRFLVY